MSATLSILVPTLARPSRMRAVHSRVHGLQVAP